MTAAPGDRDVDVDVDVCIMGGGLAGLSLGIQLLRADASLRVQVIERRAGPAPESAFKVGESTVEIGAHYFADRLGLRAHLDSRHLRKFGFRFFCNEGAPDLSRCPELGPSDYLSVPTYQIDRGIFENHLAEVFTAAGGMLQSGARVTSIDMGRDAAPHTVHWQRGDAQRHTGCRWLIDAAGRAGLLKRKLQLAQASPHHAFAAWFRVDRRINPDAWGQDAGWQARCGDNRRWLSTNHLCGRGYWVWLIPLASGSHSVGIVADPAHHDFERFRSFDGALDWLREHQPLLHRELVAGGGRLQDYAYLRHFAHDARQLLSADRWALTGDAGRFLDPFYSPGSDFIAFSNTYITRLIGMDRRGEPVRGAARAYDALLRTFYDNMLPIYLGQYGIFGHPAALSAKVIWDYTYYWSVLAPLFVHDQQCAIDLLARCAQSLKTCGDLNLAVQAFLRGVAESGDAEAAVPAPGFVDHTQVDWFVGLNRQLAQPADAAEVARQLTEAAQRMRTLAHSTLRQFTPQGTAPSAAAHALLRVCG